MLTGTLLALVLAQSSNLDVMATGAMPVIGGYKPQRLQLTADRPTGVRSTNDLAGAMFGLIKFGNPVKQFCVALVGGKLMVDSNGNGNLDDDAAADWAGVQYEGTGGAKLTRMSGGFSLTHPQLGKPLHMGAYVFDAKDEGRAALKNVLLYYTDYALTGKLSFGRAQHKVMLVDWPATGDFTATGVQLLVDRNDDGKFDGRFEYYDMGKPFNVGGTTYEVDGSKIGSGRISLNRSKQSVDEVQAPPDLSVGRKVLPFKAQATDGTDLGFPKSYKGKLVMLDFWATWCGPCVGELPNVTKAYEAYHERGFEILSISLDQENKLDVLNSFTKEHNMPWRQVYDGKFWEARVAKMYGIQSIPACFLVDGDTGTIIADASTLRGTQIMATLDSALTKKFGN